MKPGELFESKCCDYLNKTYGNKTLIFKNEGGMNSTVSDIAVLKNNIVEYFIEAKDANAQSGQFVLLPNEDKKIFIFSPKNHSKQNKITDIIIKYMNKNFENFSQAGTAGQTLNLTPSIFADWIIDYYKSKNVKYVISGNTDYIIFPIRKFPSYFDITAKYRIKKSGSRAPAKRDVETIKSFLKNMYPNAKLSSEGKKLFISIQELINTDRFVIDKSTYYLSKQSSNNYEVRKLSNTYNMNVIFSIKLKCSQNKDDLKEFENDL
ncbi:MAG: hypothetical protein E7510_00445 [Ruminococcus sp.]|nr:hypothetical protein [Ruminococcus sp.]